MEMKSTIHKTLGYWSWRESGRFAVLVCQLGLLLIVLRQFQIESNAFLRIAALAFGGFVVHYFLPMRFRLPFFALLSVAAIAVVFDFAGAAWLIGLGLILIGICHLPVAMWVRVVVLLATGSLLALLRADFVTAPWPQAIWPILGSMFMFRLMVYLYDLKHDSAPSSFARTLSYFFMLPNVCFPLFPIVDYKTFRRNYYDSDSFAIYQTGIRWMTRGVIHLILYRFIYYYLTIAPEEVASPTKFAQFVVTTFLLYLRISGQFHLIIGMLHLFGFRLPETHHLYYLSSSFTDFWRRINIYWKDFMMKLFYYPLYFKLRGLGKTAPVVIATLCVFFTTWLLHSYQWFWLRGSVLLSGPDITFWSILAVLVIFNSLYELKHGRERVLSKRTWTLNGFFKKAVSTGATFCVISLLWSLWQSESLQEWIALWESIGSGKLAYGEMPMLAVGGVIAGGLIALKDQALPLNTGKIISWGKTTGVNFILLGFLALIGIQAVYVQLGPQVATFINSLRSGRLSRLDVAMLEKGYYENLARVERFNSQLWELYMNRPRSWLDVVGIGLERFRADFLQKELVPSFVAVTNYGSVRTNRWGMRDKEYEKQPAAGTYRIALLGASSVMGWGVGDGETFESLLERRLNEESTGKPFQSYEILNFAVPGYQPPQQVPVSQKAFSFGPNALFYVGNGREVSRSAFYLAEIAAKDIPVPYDHLNMILAKAAVPPKTPESIAARRLLPFRNEIFAWTAGKIVEQCRNRNIFPVFIFLPQVEDGSWHEETSEILRIARESGFMVIDLSEVYKEYDRASIRIAEWDNHPNKKGHQIIAERLHMLLKEHWNEIFMTEDPIARRPSQPIT
jgi:D-alanyl-lipoteichoic acid acyltransferase DltB (MBOAT superfamily)